MFKKLAEVAQIDLDVANAEWDADHKDRALEWYMQARTEALVSIALSLAEIAENTRNLPEIAEELGAMRMNRSEHVHWVNPEP